MAANNKHDWLQRESGPLVCDDCMQPVELRIVCQCGKRGQRPHRCLSCHQQHLAAVGTVRQFMAEEAQP